MAVKIELLSISPGSAGVALYYPVASPIVAANDPSRTPAGTRLSPQEKQDLKDGTLFELVKSVSLSGMSKAQAKDHIEGLWENRKAEAKVAYAMLYRDADLVGKVYDGTSWS